MSFQVKQTSGHARLGVLSTGHGEVPTPAFMPVGTQGTVKALSPQEVAASGARMLIANTYHLWLRPGAEQIAELGGLHAFMRWPHAIATDSGGFQAFSLASRTKLSETGFEFSSHIDGSRHLLSPEEAMRVQGLLGSDIALQLDVCLPGGASREQLVDALQRTTRWAERCLQARQGDQLLFGIVQGGTDVDLRLQHAETLAGLTHAGRALDGLALGGFSVGEPNQQMHETLKQVAPVLDASRPHYLMGVGTPVDLLRAIGVGVDLFDCVMPTRNARNGQVFVAEGKLVLKNARFKDDPAPIDAECGCATCVGGFSRAYLRHLFLAGEILAHRLLTLHNLWFYGSLMAAARQAIAAGQFDDWAGVRIQQMGGLRSQDESG
jgi:queuine tRNA-ribosyltransferase